MSETKEIEVVCPCCDTTLWIDVLTQKVLRRKAKTELDDLGKEKPSTSWEEAASRVQNRMGSAKDKFDAGLDRERNRSANLDDLFKKVQDKMHDLEDDE